jgi:periplasmic protein CpxP/Spy
MTKTVFRRFGIRAATLAFSGAMLFALPMMAQDTTPAQGPPAGGRGTRGAEMQERRLKMLTQKLNLTPDQVTQVKAIQDDTANQMRTLRDDTSMSQTDKRAKMKEIAKASDDKTRALLTPDQQTKYDELQAQMKQKAQERMKERQGGTSSSQPPQ